jgi:hypothetical protein
MVPAVNRREILCVVLFICVFLVRYSLENNVEAKKAHLDRLREFVVKYGPENVFPRYVFGVSFCAWRVQVGHG